MSPKNSKYFTKIFFKIKKNNFLKLLNISNCFFKKTLVIFWKKYKDSEQPLKSWYDEAINANWKTPSDIKAHYKSASFVGNNRVIFNIAGNKYRLITAVAYQFGAIYIKFIGTHRQYDNVDVLKIGSEGV